MPPSFDPLRRLRLRSHPVPSSSSEEDSDGSSPTESTHITLALDKSQLARKRLTSCVTSVTPVDALQPSLKPTLIRRMTSKLHISIPSRSALRSRLSTRTLPADMQGPRVAVPNNAVSRERRDAALRERGLLPPHKDFSEQERDSDKRLGSVPSPTSTACDGLSEAERLKAGWLANNRASESSDSDVEPAVVAPSYLEVLARGPLGARTTPAMHCD
ncbi:hypothetical protein J3R82DRAFT_11806 [Butyriboletus roseoflavus]|nr:hypothetical protein J3R82DRAFT_11806 [Butyriboletus roseoflavus]